MLVDGARGEVLNGGEHDDTLFTADGHGGSVSAGASGFDMVATPAWRVVSRPAAPIEQMPPASDFAVRTSRARPATTIFIGLTQDAIGHPSASQCPNRRGKNAICEYPISDNIGRKPVTVQSWAP